VSRATQDTTAVNPLARTGLSPAMARLSRRFRFARYRFVWSYYPDAAATATVWALPSSLATTGGITICFLLLRVLRCFSSPRLLPAMGGMAYLQYAGLPHSDIPGSSLICRSPELFAAYRVLLRL